MQLMGRLRAAGLAIVFLAAALLSGCDHLPANDCKDHDGRADWQALLMRQDFDALEQQLDGLQQRYEQGGITDLQLRSAWQGFDDLPPQAGGALDAWVARRPASYFARLARGYHHRSQAAAMRDGQWARVKQELRLAGEDAQASLPLRRTPVLSLDLLLDVAGRACDRKALDEYQALAKAYAPGSARLLAPRSQAFPGHCAHVRAQAASGPG
ncbi:MAG: DUF4034 domain-containing protein [Aquabacterium sp.]|nr:MAG: DUF4034 domain-containing protein [Aquabacterium sp.]